MKKTVIAVAISTLCGNVNAASNPKIEKDITVFKDIVVTAQKIELSPYEVNGSVDVITDQDMRQEGATELYDTLKNIPGVDVSGGAGRPQNISIRGIRGNRIKILVDGVETSDGYGADDLNDKVGRNSFDLADVKQIEVIKGAGSSLHGSGAMGGMIVVTTKDASDYLTPEKDTVLIGDSNYVGESNKLNGAIGIAQRIGSTEHLIRYKQWEGNGSDNYNGEVYKRDVTGFNLSLTSNFHIGDHQEIKTKIERYRNDMVRNEQIGYVKDDFKEKTDTDTDKYQITYHYYDANLLAFDDAKIVLFYNVTDNNNNKSFYKHYKQQNVTEHSFHNDNYKFIEKSYGLKTQFNKSIPNHNIVWGIDAAHRYHSRTINKYSYLNDFVSLEEMSPFASVNTLEFGAYISDKYTYHNWEFDTGIRYDLQQMSPVERDTFANMRIGGIERLEDVNSNAISPSLTAAYNFNSELKAYLSYNHGFNAPSYSKAFEFVQHDGIPPFDIIPNFHLKPETSNNYEFGLKGNYQRFEFTSAVFYSQYKDFIMPINVRFNEITGRMEKQFVNIAQSESYGIEFGSKVRLNSAWSLLGNIGVVTAKSKDNEYLATSTPWNGSTSLKYSDGFDAFARLNFASSMNKVPMCHSKGTTSECTKTSGWGTFDLGFSYEPISNLTLNANLNNIFDREYMKYNTVAGMKDASIFYNSQVGRNFNLSLHYQY